MCPVVAEHAENCTFDPCHFSAASSNLFLSRFLKFNSPPPSGGRHLPSAIMLHRWGRWRSIAFVDSNKGVLMRVLAEKGADITPKAHVGGMTELVSIDDIVFGDRHREEMGDIKTLAAAIEMIGLLHPIVISPDHRLIAGGRRLEACKLLGCSAEGRASYPAPGSPRPPAAPLLVIILQWCGETARYSDGTIPRSPTLD